ncbi:shikimate dehydrogenase [Halothermothrix orenii]|uniref:Shikimate dehydrogenase (NADP(+)) n=1 Tax=Halothermothrix orenii (strain H 168 / OCM 544 / DSM 9562) TaxID=373903 RepID=AROE_HALOH|nr:shikimate dehydrogenase [Halothermothrix orenii]B8D2C6.1 RecName: Full=Shikimate dehydrogenase (NADP(+)); Short=SDH [Halothermothrix orenii H 168]ACL69353.1 shikimate 5-dehydrogenase [Halothermothrix orenii H 168]
MFDNSTQVVGLMGYPLGHSMSPAMHNRAYKDLGINYVYLPLEIKPDFLKEGIEGLRAFNFRGVNVTIPYKEKVIPYLDEIDRLAGEIGAVNTIVNNGGKLKGYNTDALGFKKMLEDDCSFEIKGTKAVIIGAGGASRAVGAVLAREGASEIFLLNRTLKKAAKLVGIWNKTYPGIKTVALPLDEDKYLPVVKRCDVIIDTTPVGMAPGIKGGPVIAKEAITRDTLVVDLVYNPPETTLIKAGRQVGARTMNGFPMLIYQAAYAFKLWTGIKPELFIKPVREAISPDFFA